MHHEFIDSVGRFFFLMYKYGLLSASLNAVGVIVVDLPLLLSSLSALLLFSLEKLMHFIRNSTSDRSECRHSLMRLSFLVRYLLLNTHSDLYPQFWSNIFTGGIANNLLILLLSIASPTMLAQSVAQRKNKQLAS